MSEVSCQRKKKAPCLPPSLCSYAGLFKAPLRESPPLPRRGTCAGSGAAGPASIPHQTPEVCEIDRRAPGRSRKPTSQQLKLAHKAVAITMRYSETFRLLKP